MHLGSPLPFSGASQHPTLSLSLRPSGRVPRGTFAPGPRGLVSIPEGSLDCPSWSNLGATPSSTECSGRELHSRVGMKSQSCPPIPSSSQDGAPQLPWDSGLLGVLSIALVSSTRLGTPWGRGKVFPWIFLSLLGPVSPQICRPQGQGSAGPQDSAQLTLPPAAPSSSTASGEWAGRWGIAHAADSAPVPFPALAPISPRGNCWGGKTR